MSGKRLLDAAALFGAARSVANQHARIRAQQFDVLAKTSSLSKILRTSLGAPNSSLGTSHTAAGPKHTSTPDVEGINQDHHYKRSPDNSILDPTPDGSLDIHQEKARRYPLPDGTIPPQDAPISPTEYNDEVQSTQDRRRPVDPLDIDHASQLTPRSSAESTIPNPTTPHTHIPSEVAMRIQRQSESQIPQETADPPSRSEILAGAAGEDAEPEIFVDQERDTYYKAPEVSSPVLSALPRVKLPKNAGTEQGGDSHLPEQMNADTYYSSTGKGADHEIPSEELLQGLFHSPKAKKLVSGSVKSSYVPGGIASRKYHTLLLHPSRARFSTSLKCARNSDAAREEEEVKNLASDIARDVEVTSKQSSVNSTNSMQMPYEMRESRVPSSPFGRMFEYGGLAASMTMGALEEGFKRATGSSDGMQGSLMLSGGNVERLVAKLSKMRGAALKLGQMMSFQDSKMLPAPIHTVLQRVQDSADYMPSSQRNSVLSSNLGPNWREIFGEFKEKPIAAASIGQVHEATLKSTGQKVAVKVQYPGVATSISSDLNNLSILLTASRLLPKGLYLDKTIANARTELAWECDYVREAECGNRFQELLADETDVFVVPRIISEASGKEVITMEFMEGKGVTKVQDFTQEQKDWIGTQILRLCLREIMEFNFMQTDPNWTNFLYNNSTNKLELLDFGASREYPQKFVDLYVSVLEAASRGDRKACKDISVELGYLTGYESPIMTRAHVDSVLTLAEPFRDSAPDVYDFSNQTITDRVKSFIPVMIKERLAPPPEETYSLHRKLSGAFLLCARLGSRVKCKELFKTALKQNQA